MQEHMDLLRVLLDLTPDELAQAITLFESARTQPPLGTVLPPLLSET